MADIQRFWAFTAFVITVTLAACGSQGLSRPGARTV